MAEIISKGDARWEVLYKVWLEQRKPGYVQQGERLYRVLTPSDDDIKFCYSGGPDIDMAYESRSTKGIAR